jgi:hypothetical protein
MNKYDQRTKLNWIQRIIERIRIKREIKKREKQIEEKLNEIAGKPGKLMAYKRSGIPVHLVNIEILKNKSEKTDEEFLQEAREQALKDWEQNSIELYKSATNPKPRKIRSDKEAKRTKLTTKKNAKK